MRAVLPIESSLPEIQAAIAAGNPVVLSAPPGAGKTTAVPLALLPQLPTGQILLVQPRRLAARSAAAQIARLARTPLGGQVGYQVRFDRRDSADTRLLVVTYGILLRRLQADPFLDGIACVILDEFHERSLEADLCLGMLQRVRQHFRADLRLMVMSATLSAGPLLEFLTDAVAIDSPGRMFPVQIDYRPPPLRSRIADAAVALVPQMLQQTTGHVLVFLPGVGEIQSALRQLAALPLSADVDCLPLYADLSPAEQDRVLGDSDRRKVIVATNVAETSITIAGVTGVIDSGQARVLRHDSSVGLPQLMRQPISQASADQRTGRAGRTAAGICWRLWDRATHASRPRFDTPEILRGDLAPARLILADWDEHDPLQFPWLDRPAADAMGQATKLLKMLQILDDDGVITPLGRQVAGLPVHPRLGKLLVVAAERGVLKQAALAAALMTERVVLSSADLLAAVEQANGPQRGTGSHPGWGNVLRSARQLISLVPAEATTSASPAAPAAASPATVELQKSLLAAFPDRVARQRAAGSDVGLMVGGKGITADCWNRDAASRWILCLKLNAATTNARVDLHCEIDRDWLPPSQITIDTTPLFSAENRSLQGRRQERYFDLLISDTPVKLRLDKQSARLLVDHALQAWGQPWPIERTEVANWLARVTLLRQTLGDDTLPDCNPDSIQQVAIELAMHCRSLDELQRGDWIRSLSAGYSYEQTRLLENEAPQRLKLPSGNSAEVHYDTSGPPVLKARIQELFGWTATPRIARGRVPVQLHLLGPNYRTEQITDDLQRFWQVTYHQVRKDLRGRYPKHQWPEDPLAAIATRNGLKPRT